MITETHQCPFCSAILSAREVNSQHCNACTADCIPRAVSTQNKPSGHRLGSELHVIDRLDLHILNAFDGGFGHFLD